MIMLHWDVHTTVLKINLMYNIPGMDIVVPGSSEFDRLFKQGYKNNPKYFRLTDFENKYDFDVKYGKGNLINNSSKTTIITFDYP